MEISVCSSLNALSFIKPSKTSPSFHSKPSNLNLITKNTTCRRYSVSMHVEANSLFGFPKRSGGGGGGAGILERPNLDTSIFEPTPKVEEGGDMGKLKNRTAIGNGDGCKVLLIDDTRHTENQVINPPANHLFVVVGHWVASVLPKAVPAVTTDAAKELFHESRQNGAAVVIVAVKEHAEFYLEMMTNLGLSAAIEPDSSTV
ncbi:hypothetical protein MKW92_045159 [Papaver armeniacum]|nr:hypothetical protein MKW92_045159 [Papaver armeniacum]